MNSSETILKICHSYPREKLDVETIAILANLSVDEVSKSLDELKEARKLPRQYLTHLMN